MAKEEKLFEYFKPTKYELTRTGDLVSVYIEGQKVGRPNKRIRLHQKGLKVRAATITKADRRGERSYTVTRLNLLPTRQELRIHTKEQMGAGLYKINVSYVPKAETATKDRSYLPCIDEPEAWDKAEIKL